MNDQYQAPPVDGRNNNPYPPDLASADRWMKNNALYAQLVPVPVRCELDVLDWTNASNEQRMAHSIALRDCLMRAWDPPVRAAGFNLTTPAVKLFDGATDTPCGSTAQYAGYYCSQDQTIYLSIHLNRTKKSSSGALIPEFETLFAHEFGHHVQGRVGIMWASWMARDNSADKEHWNQLSRMTELQAQCFAGMFMNSVTQSMGFSQSDREEMIKGEYNRVVDEMHGSQRNYGVWWQHGFENQKISECNAFNPRNPETIQ